MRYIKKVLATCQTPTSGVPNPRDEPEVPLGMRNPYKSTFIERILMQYQEPPTGHPYNPCEHLFTPETLMGIEKIRMMTPEEKLAVIKKRDTRWFDGRRAAPKNTAVAQYASRYSIVADNTTHVIYVGSQPTQKQLEKLRNFPSAKMELNPPAIRVTADETAVKKILWILEGMKIDVIDVVEKDGTSWFGTDAKFR